MFSTSWCSMVKRLTLAQKGRGNLFTGEKGYRPARSLQFESREVEREYGTDAERFSRESRRLMTYVSVAVCISLYIQGYQSFWLSFLCIITVLVSSHLPTPYTRLILTLPNILLTQSLTSPSPSDQFCSLLPSFSSRTPLYRHPNGPVLAMAPSAPPRVSTWRWLGAY